MPKIIKVGRNLTKLWQKQFCSFFWDTVYFSFNVPCYCPRGRERTV